MPIIVFGYKETIYVPLRNEGRLWQRIILSSAGQMMTVGKQFAAKTKNAENKTFPWM